MRLILILSSILMFALGTACERRQAQDEPAGRVGEPTEPGAPGGRDIELPGPLGDEEREPVAGREGEMAGGALVVIDQSGQQAHVTDQSLIRQVEEKLKGEDLDPGSIDGKADEKLSAAIREFQQKRGLPATGYLNMQTAQALGLDWQQFQQAASKHEMGSGGEAPSAPQREPMRQPRE